MSVMAITGISPLSDGSEQRHSRSQQNSTSQQGSSTSTSGLAAQGLHLQVNGIRAAASDDPQETLRIDREALQTAIDSKDLADEQRSLIRIIADTQEIASAQKAVQSQPASPAISAMPASASADAFNTINSGSAPGKNVGKLIDVMA